MSWTVVLEDEKRKKVDSLSCEFTIKLFHEIIKCNEFFLIKYLDPYGDTSFNNLQMDDLIIDLKHLVKLGYNNNLIDEVVFLANKCKDQPHLFLTFYGD